MFIDRVIAWEPVPKFRMFLEYGMQLNGFQGLVQIRAAAVADKNGEIYTLQVPQRGIWGTASIGGGNIDRYWTSKIMENKGCAQNIAMAKPEGCIQSKQTNCCRNIDNEGEYEHIEVKGERVDSVVQEDVLLMKLDVEGFEPVAFQSSMGILDNYK